MITTDAEAWEAYPYHRNYFNKLWLSQLLGYKCGPAGTPIPNNIHNVITRPIYNLSGMGVGAKIHHRKGWDSQLIANVTVPAGHFWCQLFEGDQTSTTYEWRDGGWKPVSRYLAFNPQLSADRQQQIEAWVRQSHDVGGLSEWFNQLSDVGTINVERVGMNIIEVHLRGSTDPEFETVIPLFVGQEKKIVELCAQGYQFIYDYDSADGQLKEPRIGFACSNVPYDCNRRNGGLYYPQSFGTINS